MREATGKLLRPRWIAWTLVCWAAAGAMVWLGQWQLRVSDEKHFAVQNFSYTLQWWAFAAFAVGFWIKTTLDHLHPPADDVAAESGELVLRSAQGKALDAAAYHGPAQFVTAETEDGMPEVYRGYRIPRSSEVPHRASDELTGAYNDYLWQLALADGEVARANSDDEPPAG